VGLVHLHATEWRIDPSKIGVLGFSAGGHLVAALSTHFMLRLYPPVDAAHKESCRPNFALALYPGHLWIDEEKFELNPDIHVTDRTPPTFLVQTEDNPVDDVDHSLVYYIALENAGVPWRCICILRCTELPITGWPQLMETWLGMIGIILKQFVFEL
jgi:acetyl esterase/lipase